MAEPALEIRPHVLREYALLADGERGALVGPRGDVAWLCFPGWDGDPLFASLLGAASRYAVHPTDRSVWGGYYQPGSLIWHSRWASGGSIVESREALAFPGDPRRAVLLRRVAALRQPSQVVVGLDLRTGWGRRRVRLQRGEDGAWTGQAEAIRVRWSGAAEARPHPDDDGLLVLCLDLGEGDERDLVLELDTAPLDASPADPQRLWAATEAAWRDAVPHMHTAATRDARHACAVLRGLTTQGGGMVACATTSLPERATRGRDYDYRYVWIRDQSYAGQAAAVSGATGLLDSAVRFTAERLLADGPRLRPAYRSDGSPLPEDAQVDLPGYPGAPEVHRGNRAGDQFQLDTFGEALLLFATAAAQDRLDAQAWRAACVAAEAVAQRWEEPDAGIWELVERRRWTHSRLVCAAGLQAIAGAPGAPAQAADGWRRLARRLVDETSAHCVHPSGRWQRAPDDDRVDAALLVPAIRGAISPADSRTTATVAAVRSELSREGFVYRYRHRGEELHEAEGAFLLCGFWMSLATLQQGDALNAVRWFERSRTACGPPGLLSEEYDVRQRQLRGNLPQAFVHAALLETAARLHPHVGDEP